MKTNSMVSVFKSFPKMEALIKDIMTITKESESKSSPMQTGKKLRSNIKITKPRDS